MKAIKSKLKVPRNGDDGSTSETPQPFHKNIAQLGPIDENKETFMNRVKAEVKISEKLK